MKAQALRVAIVGGGPGCKAIIDMIFAEKLSQLRMKLIGVACTNPKAEGYRYAVEKGIYVTRDYRNLYQLKGLDMIIELTGRAEVANDIFKNKPDWVSVMDHVAARLFWDVFQIEERRIAERKKAQAAVIEANIHLEHLLDTSAAAIYKCKPEGSYPATFVSTNVRQQLGYEAREFTDDPEFWASRIHPKDVERVFKNLSDFFEKGYHTHEYRFLHKDGSYRWMYDHLRLIRDNQGNPSEIIGTWIDITDRKQAEDELSKSHKMLRNLSAHIEASREQERKTIAREIHDDLGQTLTVLQMDLRWVQKRLNNDQKLLYEKLELMTKLVGSAIQSVNRISSQLRPYLLDQLGLMTALDWMARKFEERTGIVCELLHSPDDIVLDYDVATAIFRIFQEALTNITRHASATDVKARFRVKEDKFELTVRDNGRGITEEESSSPESFGLIGMRERALILGGQVEIRGIRNKGTTVKVIIPKRK